ncbi:coiled-coil domain-containing protein 42 homolog isoform X2 [Triplophysa rosa]|uniref:Coiled-coil domain-containing protein 42 like-2-like n=1 Tax=Triplophysa rosa TaxID=992332 RepID=A0A9W7TVB2_TRIRA|nr:coiled-coil domain-containing protein 42 homolog isoform X2 [Triplophysa rosa]KAI7804252.1 putative coiled-coil domain-containing protein 42 like-2-like [Triplophysa rosa]
MDLISLPVLTNEDSHKKLKVENRRKNIFVTQLDELGEQNTEQMKHIPVITECSSGILETGVNTLQSTLLLKKQVEMIDAHRKLLDKRHQFKRVMQILQQRRADLQHKQLETKQRAAKFEKFVEENEIKRRRALKKFLQEKQQNECKEKEKAELSTQLEQLQARRLYLQERVKKYKIFEEFLLKVLQVLPDNYLGYGTDLVTPIIRRHETLSTSRQELLQQLTSLTEELKTKQHHLDALKQQHSTYKLMSNQKLTELQTQLDEIKEKRKQLEMKLQMSVGQSRDQVEEMGNIFMAVRNLGEQCSLNHYGPLDVMDTMTMMDMIKEYIMEKADLEKRAMRLPDASSGTPGKKASSKSSSRPALKIPQ